MGIPNEIKRVSGFRNVLGKPGTEVSSLELVIEANGKHPFHLEIPFENFELSFKKSRFPREISIWEEKKIVSPFTFHPKFLQFWGKW